GEELPWDGKMSGELQVRGPWIAADYYNDPRSGESFTADGWLRTGDVAVIDPEGYIRLVDRTKDVVKSGGEWISSVELENEIMADPRVAEAAVIGVHHRKWSERPLACVVPREGETLTKDDVITFLDGRVAKWWLPDDVAFAAGAGQLVVGQGVMMMTGLMVLMRAPRSAQRTASAMTRSELVVLGVVGAVDGLVHRRLGVGRGEGDVGVDPVGADVAGAG